MAKLWANEAARVFHDRLTDDADREWFVDLAMDLLSREFRSSMERDDLFGASKVMVGDLLRLDAPKKLYEVIADQKKLYKQLNYFLDELNMSSSNRMNLVFFEDAILHCLRIARVLRQSRGSLMLIGMGGSGKQSLIRMSSFMYEMSFRQLEIVKGFNSKLFRERIKEMMFDAALRGVKIAFAITDSMIIDESFLEDLNNMLNTGEIPNLMLPEDKEAILGEEMRKIVTDRKLIDTAETLQAVFVDRVREFFHICLCMSPVGDTLRLRVRQFPSLVNCCTIDWFSAWPREALLFVSTEFLADLELPSEEVRTNLAEMCASVHVSVKEASARFDAELRRKIYTTPKSYLDLISLYINKLADKRLEHNSNRDRLAIGLKKLGDTKVDIDEFKVKLAEAAPQLKIQSETLNVQVEVVVGKQKLADEQKKLVQAEAEIVGKKASDAGAIEAEAKTELDAAEPEVKRAKAALNAISAKDLVELKSAAKQLPGTLKTMQVVFILAREENKAREWAYIKNKIGNPATLLKELVDYDVDKHPEKAFTKVRKDYINDPDWTRENVAKLSVCAANLYDWCIATVSYQALMKKIKPKMARLKEVKEIADSANAELKQKKDQLQAVLDEVQFLNDDLNAKKATLEDLEATIERCTAQLGRAEALVVLLADEGIRWKATCESLQVTIDNLVGDVFLSCACISYYGGFTGDYRLSLTD
jgi:dynein heavy chain